MLFWWKIHVRKILLDGFKVNYSVKLENDIFAYICWLRTCALILNIFKSVCIFCGIIYYLIKNDIHNSKKQLCLESE